MKSMKQVAQDTVFSGFVLLLSLLGAGVVMILFIFLLSL
jgi:hypothetical protein